MKWLERALSRRWLWLQLGAGAVLLVHAITDITLVEAHVSCAVYRQTIQGWPGEVIAYSSMGVLGGSFFVRLTAQFIARQGYRAILGSVAIFALELALLAFALTLVVDKTLFYCAFEGVKLNACEMGFCAH